MKNAFNTLILGLLFVSLAEASDRGLHLGLGGMALTSSTKQGGQGPSGSTVLTHSELVYNWPHVGFGFFFQYDKQGSTEVDSGYGPKLEFSLGDFFIDIGYGMLAQRAFTDRSIANQKGTSMYYGIGTRFRLGKGGGGGKGGGTASGMFFHGSYKYRTQTIKEQDGVPLDEPISQTDGYPVAGLGYIF